MQKSITIMGSIVLILLAGCKKPVTEPNSGIYRGTFFQILDNGDTISQGIAYLALSKGEQSFTLSGDTTTGAPLSCYGDYVINNATQMTFTNEAVVDFGYQPHIVLDTLYSYTFDNRNFKLELEVDTKHFEYNLVRN
jgi:hypothetical protein